MKSEEFEMYQEQEKVQDCNPKIAVVIPVFNVGSYLAECLDSFLAQTYKNFNLYVVNDGSTDLSGEVLNRYKEIDLRIQVIHKKNEGVSSARNVGLKAAIHDKSVEYICFVDGDDKVTETFLQDMLEAMTSADVQYGFCLYQEFGKNGLKEFSVGSVKAFPQTNILTSSDEVAASYFLLGRWKDCCGLNKFLNNKMFHKDLLNECYFKTDLPVAQDMEFFLQVLPKIKKAVFVEKFLFLYRRRKSSSSLREKLLKECRYRIFTEMMTELNKFPSVARVSIQNDYVNSVYELFRFALAYEDTYWIERLKPVIRGLLLKNWLCSLSIKVRKRLILLTLPLFIQKKLAKKSAFKKVSKSERRDYFD